MSVGLSADVVEAKDTTIWIRNGGNIDTKKIVIAITYDTLNPWVYYNSPLGLFYRLGWHKNTDLGWKNMTEWMEKYEWLKPIAAFSGYLEACFNLQKLSALEDSLKYSLELLNNLTVDSLSKIGLIELPDEILKELKIKEVKKKCRA